ncbi:MAG: secondary thiamine-phosphate synthase enzyme YjbQ [Eubacteriales bacterium]|nr:secondary thiamine-phosphate synthase enzyme YjbQ [Eubacteriales bacterium]
MLREFTLRTSRENWINITPQVRDAIRESGVLEGLCHVHCPHTTAGITVNENTDPDVVTDLVFALDQTYPDRPEFRHVEGNSAAHLKASVIGCGVTLIVHDGKPLLGIWQGVYFCEFDGPRTRRVCISVQGGNA